MGLCDVLRRRLENEQFRVALRRALDGEGKAQVNARQTAFVHAYLTDAKLNGTQAAILAGYSQVTAAQIGSRLLKHPEVRAAVTQKLEKVSAKADLRTHARLEKLAAIADSTPEKVTGSDVVAANKLILQVNGALKDKTSESRITVHIGFLSPQQPIVSIQQHQDSQTIDVSASHIDDQGEDNATTLVMAPQTHVAQDLGDAEPVAAVAVTGLP